MQCVVVVKSGALANVNGVWLQTITCMSCAICFGEQPMRSTRLLPHQAAVSL